MQITIYDDYTKKTIMVTEEELMMIPYFQSMISFGKRFDSEPIKVPNVKAAKNVIIGKDYPEDKLLDHVICADFFGISLDSSIIQRIDKDNIENVLEIMQYIDYDDNFLLAVSEYITDISKLSPKFIQELHRVSLTDIMIHVDDDYNICYFSLDRKEQILRIDKRFIPKFLLSDDNNLYVISDIIYIIDIRTRITKEILNLDNTTYSKAFLTNNKLILCSEKTRIYDTFTKESEIIDIKNVIAANNNNIITINNQTISQYNIITKETTTLLRVDMKWHTKINVYEDYVFVTNNNSIDVYYKTNKVYDYKSPTFVTSNKNNIISQERENIYIIDIITNKKDLLYNLKKYYRRSYVTKNISIFKNYLIVKIETYIDTDYDDFINISFNLNTIIILTIDITTKKIIERFTVSKKQDCNPIIIQLDTFGINLN